MVGGWEEKQKRMDRMCAALRAADCLRARHAALPTPSQSLSLTSLAKGVNPRASFNSNICCSESSAPTRNLFGSQARQRKKMCTINIKQISLEAGDCWSTSKRSLMYAQKRDKARTSLLGQSAGTGMYTDDILKYRYDENSM